MSRPRGFKHTPATIEKLKNNHQGFVGFKHSEESKKKISESLKGKIYTKERNDKISQKLMGHKLSEETKKKIGLANSISQKGKIISDECKRKIGDANRGIKNGQWKGDEVGYSALHEYIKHYLPKPKLCSCCKNEGYVELCNISGLYKRNFSDWKWLCRRCHMKDDNRLFNFKKMARKRKINAKSSTI